MYESIVTPLDIHKARALTAGDYVSISGVLYVARDAAHKQMIELLDAGKPLPFGIYGQVIYYSGPCPAKPGQIIGSCGPTTSGRMDSYTPRLLEMGLMGMIGKGARSTEVISAMKEFGAVYFGATGGAGALISRSVISQEIIAFPELGPEALRRITVKDFPAIVVIDSNGTNLYETERQKFRSY